MNNNLAFVFPGQGSQSIGMLQELATQQTAVQGVFADAEKVMHFDLWNLAQNGPVEQLDQTQYTQPAMLAAGIAVYRVWQDKHGEQPKLMAGHSLGEYAALVAAGALEFTDGIALVAERARLMQEAVPQGAGAMAAIVGLTDQQVAEICELAAEKDIVEPANFNSIGQVVIAGHTAAVERAVKLAEEKGARLAKLIPVSVSCHCSLLKDAAKQYADILANTRFKQPSIAVINNVDVEIHNHPDEIRNALMRQLYKPVRWVETIQRMAGEGIQTIIESGPGKVLTGLNKRIDRNIATLPVYDSQTLQQALETTH